VGDDVNISTRLLQALADAGLPVISVSIPDPLNRATWSAQYTRTLTPAEHTTEQTIGAAISIDDPQDAIHAGVVAAVKATDGAVITALTTAQMRLLLGLFLADRGYIAFTGGQYVVKFPAGLV
jgi:hypothetical protein